MTDFRTDRRTLLQLGALSAGSLFSNPAQQSSLPSQKMTNTTSVATHRGDLKHHTAALMTIDDEDVPATPIECRRLARGPNESLYAKAIKSHMEQYGSLDKVLARFSNIDEQPHPPLPTYEEHLSFFQADRLVGQAAGLLERCRVADIEFRDLSVKAFNLHQDTIAYDRAREILADEIGDGLLAVPADVSRAQFLAEFSNTKNINDALTSLANVNARYEKADFDLQIHDVKWLAWGNHYPANATPEQLQDTKAGGLDERAGKIPTLMQIPAAEMYEREFYIAKGHVEAAIASLTAGRDSSLSRAEAIRIQNDWDRKNCKHQLDRIALADDLARKRLIASQSPDGELNFDAQRDRLLDRFCNDFSFARSRMSKGAEGLRRLFGYTDDAPLVDSPTLWTFGDFERALRWTRKAMVFLDRFQATDQSYSISVSLRHSLSVDEWEQGKASGQWQFRLDEHDDFLNQRHVRLRGVSMFVVNSDGLSHGVWRAAAAPPHISFCRHMTTGHVEPLIQEVPFCFLGRVDRREAQRTPEIVGLNLLYNLSPLGDQNSGKDAYWTLRLSERSTDGAKRKDILQDIQLDLYVAVKAESHR